MGERSFGILGRYLSKIFGQITFNGFVLNAMLILIFILSEVSLKTNYS